MPRPPVDDETTGSSRQRLLASALACVDEHGVDATTIDMIRRRAGSSIGSLYHHFGNKEGLLAALFFELLDDQLDWSRPRLEAATTARNTVAALVHGYLDWVSRHPREARFMYAVRQAVAKGPQADALKEKNRRRFGELLSLLETAVKAGEVRHLPRETYASLLVGPSENYCRAWLAGRVKGAPVDHADVFVDAAWRSIAVNGGACD